MVDFLNNLIERRNGDLPSIGSRPISRFELSVPTYDTKSQDEEKKSGVVADNHPAPQKNQPIQPQLPDKLVEQSKERADIETIVAFEPSIIKHRTPPEVETLESKPKANVPKNNEKSTEGAIVHKQTLVEKTVIEQGEASNSLQERPKFKQNKLPVQPTPLAIQLPPKESILVSKSYDKNKGLNEPASPILEQNVIDSPEMTIINRPLETPTQVSLSLPTDKSKQSDAPQPTAESTPTINVTIGRIEIRAAQSKKPALQGNAKTKAPPMSLDDYLKKRARGD